MMRDLCAWPSQMMKAGASRLKAVGHVIKNRPHVAIIPLVFTGLLMGLGIWGVIQGAQSYADNSRQDASQHTAAAASAMQLTVQEAVFPAIQLADWVIHTRNWTVIKQQWFERTSDWYNNGPGTVALAAAPFGVVSAIYPGQPASDDKVFGLNLMLPGPLRQHVLEGIKSRVMSTNPPYVAPDGLLAIAFQIPIFISNVSASDSFDIPWNATDCPDYCYDSATRTKWWGMATTVVNTTEFLSTRGPLSSIAAAGYRTQIWRPPSASFLETDWTVLTPTGNRTALPEPEDVIVQPVKIGDVVWQVHVWKDTWQPDWKGPLMAVVVVGSVAVGLLIFTVLLSWEENRLLLHSILPEAAISKMRSELHKTHKSIRQMLNMVELDDIVSGEVPSMVKIVAVRQALQRSADVYRPTNQELQSMIKDADNLDQEVRQALVHQLAGNDGGYTSTRTGDSELEYSISKDLTQELAQVLVVETPQPAVADSSTGHYAQRPLPHNSPALLPKNKDPALPSVKVNMAQLVDSIDSIKAIPDPEKPLSDQLQRVLQTADNWQFDAFELEDASGGRPLSALGFYLMNRSGCINFARIGGNTLTRFLQRVEDGYKANPYHNCRHAADVLQTFHVLLHRGGLMPTFCDPLNLMGCYLSAIIHDYEHVGRSNDFLINTADELAIRYNDHSPMESHHVAAAWSLLQRPEYNMLSGLGRTQREKIRKLTIDLVLATDMKQHFAVMGKFTTLQDLLKPNPRASQSGGAVKSLSGVNTAACERSSTRHTPTREAISHADQMVALRVALKCADLGHLAAPLPVHLRWVSALETELFIQGDAERAKGMPISPLCDRNKEGVTKSQVGFFDFVVLPTYKKFTEGFPACQPLLNAVLDNYQYWQTQETNKARYSNTGRT